MMKFILLTFIFSSSVFSSTIRPDRGLYYCKAGNEESICDQIVKPYFNEQGLSAITVEYVGECGSMGPYSYYCQDSMCEDPGLRFEFRDSKHYRWENKQYGFVCEFEKK